MRTTMGRRAYPSDLTDKQWAFLEPLIPEPSTQGRPVEIERRELVSAHPLRQASWVCLASSAS
ncbi:MAG TPA: hypothetical protein VHZ51_19620 [Ktedonobacteraceae bacterium]|nr:hypothetical protein [Ktedonobacteraceae bacterium]